MIDDIFKTVLSLSQGSISEQRSKFISILIPVKTVEDVKGEVEKYRKQYYDARHVCWAYVLGTDRLLFRSNDDGEPASTAGKPILGAINSHELTDVLIIVIRYFGGLKLGTSGLTIAYKAAARDAIANAQIVELTMDDQVGIVFEYPFLNGVMRVIKEEKPQILDQKFDMDCTMSLQIRKSMMEQLKNRLLKVDTLKIIKKEADIHEV
ncbi:hypothetical protein AwDysgo_09680 [Bacteroidales bacterium]|nr:hypothetical protein AwDysgo_09680 [Bacteroidales bacterium]